MDDPFDSAQEICSYHKQSQ
uniref:PFU domain-containing protein n=1 Tax=Anguilla anguilla TaxID=7936 RepID=A0A0E9XWD1_ANGAN